MLNRPVCLNTDNKLAISKNGPTTTVNLSTPLKTNGITPATANPIVHTQSISPATPSDDNNHPAPKAIITTGTINDLRSSFILSLPYTHVFTIDRQQNASMRTKPTHDDPDGPCGPIHFIPLQTRLHFSPSALPDLRPMPFFPPTLPFSQPIPGMTAKPHRILDPRRSK